MRTAVPAVQTKGGNFMKQATKRALSILMALAMVLSFAVAIAPQHVHAASSFTTVNGWNESLYATIAGISDSDVTAVSYSGAMSGSLTGDDLEYLVRDSGNGVRIDIPGLKAGTYSLSVTTKSGEYAASNIQVAAHDRSGYAHWNYTQGIGAYNDDGTLKPGAIVLYVTDSNKNTVTVTSKDGTTVTGIGNILNSGGGQYKVDSTTGLPIEHKLNTNQQILRRLADDGTPLVVRFIGRVTAPEGLTAYSSNDYGGTVGDNGFMARMQSGLNITLEGIGADAIIDGWGIHFIAQTSYPDYGKSFEARNIEFRNVPEDCLGMEGQQANGKLTAPVERCWVHHCSFYGPTISNPAESDKGGGDGAVDFKRGQLYTMSYCYFEGYHKTCLIGSTNSALQFHITWHHNHWKNCESRAPLTRQANVHIYNNVFENQLKDGMSLRANCFVYSEYNTYIDSVVNDEHNDGRAKCYNNKYLNSTVNTSNGALYNVTDRNETIDSKCTYANFDTNPAMGYVASGDYLLQPSTTYSCQAVMAYAGPMAEDASAPVLVYDEEPKPNYSGPPLTFIHNFTTDNLTSDFYTITGTLSTGKGSTSYAGNSLKQCLLVYDSAASVSFTAPYAGTLVMVFGGGTSDKGNKILVDGASRSVDGNNQLILELEAGEHTITKGSDQVQLWYLDFTTFGSIDESHTHSYGATVVAPTCIAQGYTLYTCACGDSYKEAYVNAKGHSYTDKVVAPTCTAQGYTAHTCSVCGITTNDTYVAALGHSFSGGVCQNCGLEDPATHTHSYTAKVTAPTCTAQGYTTHTCSCGESYKDTYVDALGHSYSSAVTAPTCTAQGYTSYTCSVCGSSYKDTYVAALGHSYADGKCTVCGETDPSTLPPASPSDYIHSFTDSALESSFYTFSGALATNKGKVTYNGATLTQCLVFDSSDDVISFNAPAAGQLTMVFGGSTSDKNNKILLNGTTYYIDANNQLIVDIPAGSMNVKKSDTVHIWYVAYVPSEEVPEDPHTHSYSSAVTAPTCTAQGYTTYTCSCGDSYVDNYVAALGHDYVSSIKAPTCTESGLRTNTCNNCGDVTTEVIPANGHSYSDGKCTVCGAADPNYQAPDENIKNGLAKGDDGNYYYYINNEVQWNYTGLIANSAGNWYIKGGQAQLSYDGLITFEGTKYLIKAGHVNTAFTGITKQEGVYYYFNQGVNDLEFEGLVYCNGMKAYVQDGEVNFNKTGIVEDEGKLVYVKYGIWRNTFKGLARTDDGKWIYMANGTFDETYTGVAKLNANWVYVNAGYVDSSYSGTVNVNGVNYTVKYGVVQF